MTNENVVVRSPSLDFIAEHGSIVGNGENLLQSPSGTLTELVRGLEDVVDPRHGLALVEIVSPVKLGTLFVRVLTCVRQKV